MPAPYNWKQRLALLLLPPIGAVLIRLLGATLSFQDIGPAGSHADENPGTRVYCLWHRSLLSIAYHFRKRKIAILISPSFDGELITRTIGSVGYTPVRGSSSRGGAAGLIGMERALAPENPNRRNYAAFTADGPRGPLYYAKPGGVMLAQRLANGNTGSVGVFFAMPQRAWTLRSWDGFLIPKPFSRIIIAWQPPVAVPAALDEAALEATRQAVEDALERARHAAETYCAHSSSSH